MTETDHPSTGAAALASLLDEAQAFAPEYGGGMSSHLPMALTALSRLGADAVRLREFASIYARRLEPAAPVGESLEAGLSTLVDRLPALLPALLPGLGAAAFHGLIRTAYAVESGHAGELAAALAYWSKRNVLLGPALPHLGELTVADWVARVEARLAGWTSDKRSIFGRMLEVARLPAFAEAVDGLKLTSDLLQRLSALAAVRYLQTRNFTVLHLITSCHALRLLMPWITEPEVALRWYAQAYAAGVVASGARPSPGISIDPQPWGVVVERAIASNDDHVVKLVYTCREEAAHYGDDLYRRVAALAVSAA